MFINFIEEVNTRQAETDKEDLLIGERQRRQKLSRTYALAKRKTSRLWGVLFSP